MIDCPVCGESGAKEWSAVVGYRYFECLDCESIFIEPSVLLEIDGGRSLVEYSTDYWNSELTSARERSYGTSIARVAEVILYARRPIHRFLDIGTGPGYLLDALSAYLPASADRFYGVEMFPPKETTSHKNFHIGEIASLNGRFDAGSCIEVIEHLTPTMLRCLLSQLAAKSEDGALYIFNTGLPEYVNREDRGYMDPTRRGHIVSYGLRGVAKIAKPLGFRVIPIPGKTWAFCLEFNGTEADRHSIQDRIWSPAPENKAMLHDSRMGSLLYVLALDTARAYY